MYSRTTLSTRMWKTCLYGANTFHTFPGFCRRKLRIFYVIWKRKIESPDNYFSVFFIFWFFSSSALNYCFNGCQAKPTPGQMVLRALTVWRALPSIRCHLPVYLLSAQLILVLWETKEDNFAHHWFCLCLQPDQLIVDSKKFTIFHLLVTKELLKANTYLTFHSYVGTIY